MSTIPVDLLDDLHQFEAALIEGLESGPAEEWTSQEWAEIKQRVIGGLAPN